MAKRKSKKVVVAKPAMSCTCMSGHGILASLTAITFALFVITLWPAAMTFVHSVHWGIWLAIAVVLGIICKAKYCTCK